MGEKIIAMLNNRKRTDFLFVKPSVLHSIASILGLFDNYYKYNTSGASDKADIKAIQRDWEMIGQDLNDSMVEFDLKLKKERLGLANPESNQQLDITFNE